MSDLARLRTVARRKGRTADAIRTAQVRAVDMGRSRSNHDYDAKAMLTRLRNDGLICPLIVARAAASIPLRVYRRVESSGSGRVVDQRRRRKIAKRYNATKAASDMLSTDEVIELTAEEHPLASLLAKPNTLHSGTTYRTVQLFNLIWAGNAYEAIDMEGGVPASLLMLPPHETVPVVSPESFLEGYRYSRDGGVAVELDAAEVVHHMHTVDPTDPFRGFGPLHAVIAQLEALNEIVDAEYHKATNNQRPDFHVKFKGAMDGGAYDELKEYYSSAFASARNAPRAFFSNEMVEILPLAWSPKETDLSERFDRLRKMIWQSVGIPQSVMELNDANLASATVANAQFGAQTLAPLLGTYADNLNEQLVPYFGDDLFVSFDDPVTEDNREQIESARASVASGVMTINEWRALEGLDPIRDPKIGDTLRFNGVALEMLDNPPMPPMQPSLSIPSQFTLNTQPAETKAVEPAPEPEPEQQPTSTSSKAALPVIRLSADTDPWDYGRCCGTKANVSDVLSPDEEAAIDPMTQAIARWYNQRAPQALQASEEAVDMTPYADELEAILDEFLPDLFRNGVTIGAEELKASVEDALSVASDAAIEYARTNAPIIASTAADSASQGLTASVQAAVQQGLDRGQAVREIMDQIPGVSVSRAERIARTEVQEAQQQGKLRAWQDAGVDSKEWLLAGDSCPICNAIKGKYPGAVPMDQAFLKLGETIVGTDGRPFTATLRDVVAPPAHPNCRCTLVAVLEGDE